MCGPGEGARDSDCSTGGATHHGPAVLAEDVAFHLVLYFYFLREANHLYHVVTYNVLYIHIFGIYLVKNIFGKTKSC